MKENIKGSKWSDPLQQLRHIFKSLMRKVNTKMHFSKDYLRKIPSSTVWQQMSWIGLYWKIDEHIDDFKFSEYQFLSFLRYY